MSWVLALGCLVAVVLFFHADVKPAATRNFTYTGFVNEVSTNKVSTATISSTGAVSGKLDSGEAYTSQIPTALDDTGLSPLLLDHKVQVTGTNPSTTSLLVVVEELLPVLLIVGLLVWFVRRSRKQMGGGLGGIMGIGRSKAKVYDEDRPTTRFADIAGYEGSKAEVMEVVDFLKYPQRYVAAGAVGPKGVLMVGPPGTGKTLMARAVAGEAGVPFFALSGSSFVEMFVGVGASRVRDLFADARKRSPAIIFIDEIDAIGGRRGPGGFGSNDERGTDAQPVALGHGRLRARRQRGRHCRHQQGRDPRLSTVAARALRPDGGDPAPQPGRAHGHSRHTRPGQEARPRRGPGRGVPGHTGVLGGRPRQPRERGRHQRRPGPAEHPHGGQTSMRLETAS